MRREFGVLLCAFAAMQHQFWLLVAATVLAGYYNANAGLYRFAATELVALPFKERAISWVPWRATWTITVSSSC